MMAFYNKLVLIVIYTAYVSCFSFVHELPKCGKDDKCCHLEFGKKLTQIVPKNGIPELDIPPLDPYTVKNINVSIINMLDIVLKEGKVIGFKDCNTETFFMDFEKGNVVKNKICDELIIEGSYSVSSNPIFKKMLGNAVHGEGNVTIVFKKNYLGLVIPFDLVEKDDCNIYMQCRHEESQYNFDGLESVKFDLDKIYLGDQDISKLVVDFFNKNWKDIISSFGKYYDHSALEVSYNTLEKFFNGVPTKYFIIDEKSS